MSFRLAAMALVASLLAGAVIAHHPSLVRFGAASDTARRATAVQTVVAPQVYAVVVPPAERASGNVSEADSRSQSAPAPDFAGPGPGWG
jgi:hypothetical protein